MDQYTPLLTGRQLISFLMVIEVGRQGVAASDLRAEMRGWLLRSDLWTVLQDPTAQIISEPC